jgi:lysophospholipase L1-like esterase
MRVLVFGDSIVYGKYDSQGGWVDRLKTVYADRQLADPGEDTPSVYNLGVEGETTRRLTARLPREVVTRRNHWEDETDFAFVFAIGINDSLITDNGDFFSSPEQYRHDLYELYDTAKLFCRKLLFVGLTPVEDDNPRNQYYRSARVWEFEQVLRDVAREKSLPMVRLFERFDHGKEEEFLYANGLHPNDEGHRLIYDAVEPELQKLLAA